MGTNVFGFCAALALLSAPGTTALHLKLDTTEEDKPSCEFVMQELTRVKERVAKKVKCELVFAGGAAAPWAAKFKLIVDYGPTSAYKKGQYIVIKKADLNAPDKFQAGADGRQQYENEKLALSQLAGSKNPNRFPGYVDSFKEENQGAGFIVMQYVEGEECCAGTVGPLIGDKTKGRQIMDSFIKAITTIWDNGWAHGDHNGGNAMVYESKGKWLLKLMDFGMAAREKADEKRFKIYMMQDCFIAWMWAQKAGLIGKDHDDDMYPYNEDTLPRTTSEAKRIIKASIDNLRKAMDAYDE